MSVLAQSAFTSSPFVLTAPVPNVPDLRGLRFYLQAVTLRATSLALCMTNSVMVFIEP